MRKLTVLVIAALVCVAGLQTWRIHQLRQRMDAVLKTGAPDVSAAAAKVSGGAAYDPGLAGAEDSSHDYGTDDVAGYLLAMEERERAGAASDEAAPADGKEPGAAESAPAPGAPGSSPVSSKPSGAAGKAGRKGETGRGAQKGAADARRAARLVKDAKAAVQEGDYEQGLALLEESLQADPCNREGYRALAALYQTLGMTDQALDTYAAWSAQRPGDAVPYYQQARLLESLGRDGEALASLQRFQELGAGEPSTYPMAASLYRQLNMPAEEGAVLQAWVADAPGSVRAHQALARYLGRAGDPAGALAEFETVAQLTPGNANTHRDLASAYQRLRWYDQAASELAAAMELQPANMEFRLHAANVARQSGNIEGAVSLYNSIIRDAPWTPEALRAQQALNRLARQP